MKKTLISVSLLAAMSLSPSAFSVPTDSFAVLEWAGNVPPATVHGNGYFLIPDGNPNLQSGQLTFANQGEGIILKTSSEIGFRVVKDADYTAGSTGGVYDPATDTEAASYQTTLTSIQYATNGNFWTQGLTGPAPFAIYADGTKMVIDAKTAATLNATRLRVHENEPLAPTIKGGDSILVRALITVSIPTV